MTTIPRDPFLGAPDPVNVLDADHPDPAEASRAYHREQARIHRTVWQQNAERFATRADTYIDHERHVGTRAAAEAIREGRPGYALYLLARSVERQNRIAGGGTVAVHPGCPCGGRCPNGAAL